MIKTIKSWMAAIAHSNAIEHWATFERADALVKISRAISLETDEAILPKHLAYKADIEVALGMHEEARANYNRAHGLIQRHPKYWSKSENLAIAKKISAAVTHTENVERGYTS